MVPDALCCQHFLCFILRNRSIQMTVVHVSKATLIIEDMFFYWQLYHSYPLIFVSFFRFLSQQTSKEIWLSKCQSYSLELLMKQSGGKDCASVGMKLPNGTFISPITEDYLFWVRPGK